MQQAFLSHVGIILGAVWGVVAAYGSVMEVVVDGVCCGGHWKLLYSKSQVRQESRSGITFDALIELKKYKTCPEETLKFIPIQNFSWMTN